MVTHNQDEKLKSVGESVREVKCTAKGALLLQLNADKRDSMQQLRDDISTVLEEKVETRTLKQHTRLEILDLDEMVTKWDLVKAFNDQMQVELTATDIKSLHPAFGFTQWALISLPVKKATKVLNAAKIRIAWSICRIREINLPARCYKWLEFGHISAHGGQKWLPLLSRQSFAAAIDGLVEDARDHRPTIIAGDFNAWALEWGSDTSKSSSSEAIAKRHALLEAFTTLDVVLLNNGSKNNFNQGSAGSIVDLTFVTSSFSPNATWRLGENYT
ncbi:hypothetical protein KR044_007365, partial [Drosophila immigrans]